jgi:hypothetical protein
MGQDRCELLFAQIVRNKSEQAGTPTLAKAGIELAASPTQPGGNMEGKETRFGIVQSTLFATVTTDASCGAVNSMHDSYTPLGGLVPLFNIQTGEVIFGGVGAGLYGILLYAMLAVFIAGLMVGRTPEYLGKKVQAYDVQMAMLVVLGAIHGQQTIAIGLDHPEELAPALAVRKLQPVACEHEAVGFRPNQVNDILPPVGSGAKNRPMLLIHPREKRARVALVIIRQRDTGDIFERVNLVHVLTPHL